MGLASLVSSLVAVADNIIGNTSNDGLQDIVHIYRWLGVGDFGEPVYESTPLNEDAVVNERQHMRRLSNGEEVMQKADLTIPRPIAAQGATDRKEPLDPRDKIILPSGYTGPILDVAGPINPATHLPFMLTVILG